jgi:hypothetical protein
VVVSRDLTRCQTVAGVAPTLQKALDDWDAVRRNWKPCTTRSTTARRAMPCPSSRA